MEAVLIILGFVVVVWWLNKKLTPVVQRAQLENLKSDQQTLSPTLLEQVRATVRRGTKTWVEAALGDRDANRAVANYIADDLRLSEKEFIAVVELSASQFQNVPEQLRSSVPYTFYALKNAAIVAHRVQTVTGKDYEAVYSAALQGFSDIADDPEVRRAFDDDAKDPAPSSAEK